MKTTQNNENFTTKWETNDHAGAKKLLQNFITALSCSFSDNRFSSHQIPHAFLFLGPLGTGKKLLAKEFAKKIVTVTSSENMKSEIFEFDFDVSGTVDDLRELIKFSSLTAHSSNSKKVFLLYNFHLASITSQNTLLKTLEEPSMSSMFILVSNNNNEIETIMSRAVAVRCYATGVEQSSFEQIQQSTNLQPFLDKLSDSKSGLLVNLNAILELEQQDIRMLMQLWVNKLLGTITISDPSKVIKKIRIAQTASDDLQKNYNPKLILQEFLLQTEKIV